MRGGAASVSACDVTTLFFSERTCIQSTCRQGTYHIYIQCTQSTTRLSLNSLPYGFCQERKPVYTLDRMADLLVIKQSHVANGNTYIYTHRSCPHMLELTVSRGRRHMGKRGTSCMVHGATPESLVQEQTSARRHAGTLSQSQIAMHARTYMLARNQLIRAQRGAPN